MEAGSEGPARLAACLEGLRLLNLALEYDQAAAEQLSGFTVRERLAPLHQLLLVPQRRLAVLMQYILYPGMEVQYEVCNMDCLSCIAVSVGGGIGSQDLENFCCLIWQPRAMLGMRGVQTNR